MLVSAVCVLTIAACGPKAKLLAGGANAHHTPFPAAQMQPTTSMKIKGTLLNNGSIFAIPDFNAAKELCYGSALQRSRLINDFQIPDGGVVQMEKGLVVKADQASGTGTNVIGVVADTNLAGFVCVSDVAPS